MDMFSQKKWTPQMLLHNVSVLWHPFAIRGYAAVGSFLFNTLPLRVACERAKASISFTRGRQGELPPAFPTYFFNARKIMRYMAPNSIQPRGLSLFASRYCSASSRTKPNRVLPVGRIFKFCFAKFALLDRARMVAPSRSRELRYAKNRAALTAETRDLSRWLESFAAIFARSWGHFLLFNFVNEWFKIAWVKHDAA